MNPYLPFLDEERRKDENGSTVPAGIRNPYVQLLEDQRKFEERERLRVINSALVGNPEQEARNRQLAQGLGVPKAAVEAMGAEASQSQLTLREITTEAPPTLARKFSEEDFARIAIDDFRELSVLENLIRVFQKPQVAVNETTDLARSAASALPQTIGSASTGAGEWLDSALLFYDKYIISNIPFVNRINEQAKAWEAGFWARHPETARAIAPYAGPAAALKTYGAEVKEIQKAWEPSTMGFEDKVAQGIGQLIVQIGLFYATGGASAATTGGVTATTGGIAATTGGARTAAAVSTGTFAAMGADQQAEAIRQAGLDPAEYFGQLSAGAAITGGSEMVRLNSILTVLPPEMRKRVVSFVVARISGQAFEEGVQEAVEGVLHNVVSTSYDPDVELLEGAGEAFAVGGTVGGLFQALLETLAPGKARSTGDPEKDRERAREALILQERAKILAESGTAEAQIATLEQIVEAAAQAKLTTRDKNTLEEFVNEAAADAGNEAATVFLAPESLAQVAQDRQITVQQLAELLGVSQQLKNNSVTSTDVQVPIGKFVSAVAGTDLAAPLIEIAKLNPFLPSRADMAQLTEAGQQEVIARAEYLARQAQQDVATRESANTVRTNILNQLNAVGRFSKNVNRVYASATTSFYVSLAERLGITPQEALEQYPLNIAGERITGAPETQEPAYAALRPTPVSEAEQQQMEEAADRFEEEADRIIAESEFDYDMLDEELEKIRERYQAQIDALQQRDIVQAAEEAQAAYLASQQPRLDAMDPDSDAYLEELDRVEEEGYRIYQDKYEELEVEIMDAETDFETARDAEVERETERLEAEAIRQIEEFRRQAITELIDRFEEAYGAAALLDTQYAYYSNYDTRDRIILDENNLPVRLRDLLPQAEDETLGQARRAGYRGADTGEAATWLAAVAKGLDMSTEARMERARAMGFDVENVLYHGTDVDFEAFRTTVGTYGEGIYLTDSPELASQYASSYRLSKQFMRAEGSGPNVIATYVRGRLANTDEYNEATAQIRAERPDLDDGSSTSEREIARLAGQVLEAQGFAGHRVQDPGKTTAKAIVIYDPVNIRSVNAAFDPDAADSAELLAQEETLGQDEKDKPKAAGASVERLQMVAERGVRDTAETVRISAEERAAMAASAAATGVPIEEIEAVVRRTKAAHPISQGWEPVIYSRTKTDDKERQEGEEKKVTHEFKQIPYGFALDANGKTLTPGTANYTRRVNALAKAMTEEVRSILRRARAGDANARNILAQAAWYKAMRKRLRQEFGGLGDLFADLLGATSPNTPVRDNWFNAVDALRRASRGDFDKLIVQWEAYFDRIDALELNLRAWFNSEMEGEVDAEGNVVRPKRTKKDIKDSPEYLEKITELKEMRKFPKELLPKKENEANYGFNGRNVARAMVDLWRVIRDADPDIGRGGTAPKALNFSGNLIGFRTRATIDVWAARILQRLTGRRRIPSVSEPTVSGVMRQDGSTTLSFGLGQDVFSTAVKRIRGDTELNTDQTLSEINDDDLQALVWFIEKEIWTINNWTNAAGEGGSFELEADLTGTSEQEQVKILRRILDASPPTADLRTAGLDTAEALKAIEAHERQHAAEIEELRKLESGEIEPYPGSAKRMEELGKIARPPAEHTRLLNRVARAKERLEEFEARKIAARGLLAGLERQVDRFVGGLSIQMSQDTQGIDFVPGDADMARLGTAIREAIYAADDGATVLGSKALSTEGRYGSVERSLDLEIIAREGYDANAVWQEILRQGQDARQDSVFLSRVLRETEEVDPLVHRPGVEIYFREAADRAKLESILAELAEEGVEFLTVVVDGRRLADTMAGEMPAAVGVRLQYIPEFEQRYGMDDLSGLDDAALADKIQEKAKELRAVADRVSEAIEGVSFAGQFWYETQTAFSSEYQEKIDALTAGTVEGGAAGATGGQRWQGDAIRAGIESANRQLRETSGGEPDVGVLGGVERAEDTYGQDGIDESVSGGLAGRPGPVDRGRLSSPRRLSDGTTEAVHYGRVAGLTETDPNQWGKGGAFLPREERNRIGEAPKRTYFGLNVGIPGGYVKEAGTGDNVYYAYIPLDRLYDQAADPDNLLDVARQIFQERGVAERTAIELAIKEAGYIGFWRNHPGLGMTAVMFEPVPVSTERRPDAVPPADEIFGQTEITQHADGTQIRVAEDVGQITVSSEYGEVKAYTKGDAVVVTGSFVEEGKRGQGIGTDLYQALANLAFKRGQVLISDRSVTDQAAGAWRALAKRGYTVLENYVPGTAPDQVGGGGASPMGLNPFVALPPGKENMSYAEAVGQLMSPLMRQAQAEMADDINKGAKRLGPSAARYAAPGRRGEYSPRLREIRLNATADFSTFLHELGHHFLEVYDSAALNLRAKEAAGGTLTESEREVIDDTRRLLTELARQTGETVEGDALDWWRNKTFEQRRQMHEQFARLTEAYFMDGKAPTAALQRMFQTFKRWLIRVYSSIRDLNVELNDEVRGILDRMVAAEATIKATEQDRGLIPAFAEKPAFMDDETWRAYQELSAQATTDAEEKLTARSLRDMKWLRRARAAEIRKLQKEVAGLRASVETEVRGEVGNRPVNRVRMFLKRGTRPDGTEVQGPHKLSISLLKELFPESRNIDWQSLGYGKYGMLAKEGLDPDTVAEMFGYPSGEAMIQDLLTAEPMEDTVQAETDARMLEQYGDLASEEAINQAADEAVHNEFRGRVLAAEYSALSSAIGGRRLLAEKAQQIAQQQIGKLRASKLNPANFIAAERRAQRKAEKALAANDLAGAAAAKRDQLLNFEMAREAQRVLKERNKALDLFRRIVTAKKDSVSKSRDYDLVQAARAILSVYGLGRVSNKPLAYLKNIQAYDPHLYAALEPTLISALADNKQLDEMSVDEFMGLHDIVRQLWDLSREEKKIEVEGKKQELEAVAEQLIRQLETVGDIDRAQITQGATEAQKKLREFNGLRASMRRVESWARLLDGGKVGVFTRAIWRPISEAADRYRADRNTYVEQFRALFATIEKGMSGKKISAIELNYTFANKAELLHAILHTGNGSNKRKLLLGRQWGQEREDGTIDDRQWQTFIDRMATEGVLTKADFDFVQGVWDLLDQIKPLAQETHRKVFGRYFDEITAEQMMTPFGMYRGGYVPAIYDQFFVADAGLRAQQEAIEANDSQMFPSVASGFTKSRVEYNEVLLLDLRVLPQHIDKVLKFAHMAGPVRDVLRILKRKDVARALESIDPTAQSDMLLPWLQRSARQITETPMSGQGGRAADAFFRAIRRRSGMGLMFANLVNVAQQVTGFSLAALQVNPKYLASGLVQYISNPMKLTQAINEASPMMRDRMSNQLSALFGEIDKIIDKNDRYGQAVQWFGRHTYFMQQSVQNVMDIIVWQGAYNQALARGETEAEATKQGDAAVRQTQGTTFPEDVSRSETGFAVLRSFTHMYTYFNMWGNLLSTEMRLAVREAGLRKGAGRLLYVYFAGYAAPALLAQLIADALRGALPEDEDDDGWLDEWLGWFFNVQAKTALAFVPVAGQAGVATIGAFTEVPYDDRVGGSPAISTIEAAVRTPASVYKAVVEEGDQSRAVKDVLTLMTLMTGLPFQVAARPVAYAVDVAEGDIEPTDDLDYLRGLVTGSASQASR